MAVSNPPAVIKPVWKSRRAMLAALFPAPLRIALLVFWLAWSLALLRGPLLLDIGGSDALDTLYIGATSDTGGFYQAESRAANPDFPQADPTYRWSGPTPSLKLPWPLDAEPLKVMIRMTAPRPSQPADHIGTTVQAQGQLEWDNQNLGTASVNGTFDGNYYQFLVPTHLRPNLASYNFHLQADNTFQPSASDNRQLALLIFSVRIEPDYANFGWHGWLASFELPALLALISFCCWGIGRSVWQRNSISLICESVSGGLLLLSMIGWGLEAAPLYAPWAVILPAGWLLLVLADLFNRRAVRLPSPFIYGATLFPLLPLTQFAFGKLNLYSLNPDSVLLGLYVSAILLVSAYYINSGPTRPQLFERAFVRGMLGASAVSFLYSHFNVFQTNLYRGADFKVYYQALQRFEHGGPLYDLNEIANLPGAAARMPPGFTFLLWPFEHLFSTDTNLALLSWRIASELLLIPCILILLRVFADNDKGLWMKPAIWFFALNFGQISESLGYGQFNVVVLLGLSLMALWVKEGQGRTSWAGAALALPVGLKLYPVVSAVYFIRAKLWWGLIGLVLGGVAIIALISLTVGFDQVWFYATQVVFGVNRPEIDISNQSLWGFFGRLAVPQVVSDYTGDLPGWLSPLCYGCVIVLTLVTLPFLLRRDKSVFEGNQLKLGALALLAVLIPPFVWFHYIVPCLPAILAVAVTLSRSDRSTPRWQLALFALAYAILAYGGRNAFFFTDAVGLARLSASFRFLAAFGLWALTLGLIWQNSLRQPQSMVDKVDKAD